MIECPDHIATGRQTSLFQADMAHHARALEIGLTGKRVCIIGGGGSIGAATLHLLGQYDIGELVILDHNENALAALARQFQSAPEKPRARTITYLPIDFGSPIAEIYFQSSGTFDLVLNFAALKHVRTERDAFSALALIDTNIIKQARLLRVLTQTSPKARYFSVSTDKAANPVSFMGASKRAMEHVLFGSQSSENFRGKVTSARFANVAYSNGSLLQSFADRLSAQVPLAAPVGISRFFVSHQEAGELCLLSSVLGDDGATYIPKLDPADNLVAMEDVARQFLNANGYEPDVFTLDEADDAKAALEELSKAGKWPLILTPADTAGEKPYEEFVSAGETASLSAFHELYAIPYRSNLTTSEVEASIERFEALMTGQDDRPVTLDLLKSELSDLVEGFDASHRASAKRLDDRI